MGDRVILHSDINCCYASIEHLHHPELAGKPLAVGGDPEARHGIVLTADYIAKRYGVKTGMALWQAKEVCPDITFLQSLVQTIRSLMQSQLCIRVSLSRRHGHFRWQIFYTLAKVRTESLHYLVSKP